MIFENLHLVGSRVSLEPLSESHRAGLEHVVNDGELWSLPFTLVPSADQLGQFVSDAQAARAIGREMPFAILDIGSGAVVGSTRFRNMDETNRKLEIGYSFIARSWQRSHVNTEAKYLMLQYAFQSWGALRVELVTDVLNMPSRVAIQRLGAKQEGLLRNHMIMRGGRVRDSVVYSLIDSEWPQVKSRLENMMKRNRPQSD